MYQTSRFISESDVDEPAAFADNKAFKYLPRFVPVLFGNLKEENDCAYKYPLFSFLRTYNQVKKQHI